METKINEKEDLAFKKFKEEIQTRIDTTKYIHQDGYLKKWLIVNNWNIKKSIASFENNEEFVKKYSVDNILENYSPNEIIKKYLTNGILGNAKDGSILRIESFGHLDMKGLMYSCKKSELEQAKIVECETYLKRMQNDSKKLGIECDGITVVLDVAGTGMRNMWRPGLAMYFHNIKILEDNYPDMLKRLIVINSPKIFPLLWSLAKPFLSESTKKKINVVQKKTTETLLKYIDADQLPKYLGGTLVDENGDENCSLLINHGGLVPKEQYKNDLVENNFDTIKVAKGGVHRMNFTMDRIGSVLRWEFKTEQYDIGFGVLFQSADKVETTLVPIERVYSHLVPEDGSIVFDKEGTYILVFDNSFSMARSKEIHVSTEIIQPDHTYKEQELS